MALIVSLITIHYVSKQENIIYQVYQVKYSFQVIALKKGTTVALKC